MKLTSIIVSRLEVKSPANIEVLFNEDLFYRITYTEFGNEIFVSRSALEETGNKFKQTECYAELNRIFLENPTFGELFLVWE